MRNLIIKVLTFVVLISSCPASFAFGQDYTVEERDVLRITVYGHDDMTTVVRVSSDGEIIMPLLGNVKVASMNTQQISAKLTALLADGYIVDPQVNVFVEEFRSQNVFISGQVKKPDAYQYELDMTLIKVVTLAGGFTDLAAKGRIKITRKVKEVVSNIENAKLDEPIRPGDVIIIPESFF